MQFAFSAGLRCPQALEFARLATARASIKWRAPGTSWTLEVIHEQRPLEHPRPPRQQHDETHHGVRTQ